METIDRESIARERRLAEILELREHLGRRQIAADLGAVLREDRRRAVDADVMAELVLVRDRVVALRRRRRLAGLRGGERGIAVLRAPDRDGLVVRGRIEARAREEEVIDLDAFLVVLRDLRVELAAI